MVGTVASSGLIPGLGVFLCLRRPPPTSKRLIGDCKLTVGVNVKGCLSFMMDVWFLKGKVNMSEPMLHLCVLARKKKSEV